MQYEPVGSRVWVNTGAQITPGTVTGDHINTPGVRQITLDTGGVVHAVSAVQQSEGLLEMPKDIRLRLYREARQMRQKDEEKLQSRKALYEKYERMRGIQETIARMGASGYYDDDSGDDDDSDFERRAVQYDLRAVTAEYDAMRNEHGKKYGYFNPLNPYSEITSNSGGLVNAVQQSEGLLEMPKDIRLRLYREARQMRQKDEEKLQSQKALYEKYERMRGMQETIARMAASGYDGESPVLEHMRSSLSAYTAKYDAMRNEHEQKYGPFNPLNPYSAITSNSGGLVNAVQQSAGFTDLDDDTKGEVFKRYEAMRVQCESDLKSIQSWIRSFKFRQDISALKMSRALHPDDKETYNEQVQEMQSKIDEATSRLEAVQERLNGFAPWKIDLLKKAPPPSVQESKGFTDLDDDTREEIFQRFEVGRESLEKQLNILEDDLDVFQFLKGEANSKPEDRVFSACPFRGPPRPLSKREYLEEMDYQINKSSIERDALKEKLDEIAPWKVDLLGKAPPPSVQESKGFTDLDDDTREEIFQRFEVGRESWEKKFNNLKRDLRYLEVNRKLAVSEPEDAVWGAAAFKQAEEQSLPFRGAPRLLKREEFLEELDCLTNKLSIERDALKEKLDEIAPWKVDLLRKAPPPEK